MKNFTDSDYVLTPTPYGPQNSGQGGREQPEWMDTATPASENPPVYTRAGKATKARIDIIA